MDNLNPLGVAVFLIAQAVIIVKLLAPDFLKGWQKRKHIELEHQKQVQISEKEVDRLEVLQTLHNQTYRDEQATIVTSNQQDLIATMVDSLIRDIKSRQDTLSLQIGRVKQVLYENQEMIKGIEKTLMAQGREINVNKSGDTGKLGVVDISKHKPAGRD